MYLLLYVDDMLIACHDMKKIQKLKSELNKEFEIKDLGAARKILGMEIKRNRLKHELCLSQVGYLSKVLARYGMAEAKPVVGPMAQHFKLSINQCPETEHELSYMNKVPYASAVGSLMYLMVCTRPDLAYAVSLVSRFMANPVKEHWEAVKWLFRYLKGTLSVGLMFLRSSEKRDIVNGFVDSDCA